MTPDDHRRNEQILQRIREDFEEEQEEYEQEMNELSRAGNGDREEWEKFMRRNGRG